MSHEAVGHEPWVVSNMKTIGRKILIKEALAPLERRETIIAREEGMPSI